MQALNNRISAFLVVGFAAFLLGCSGQPTLSNWGSSSRQLPLDAVVLGPNEKVTLNTLPTEGSNYFCSNGAVLQCERFGLKLHCSCPGILGE
jgi:hypothetical protein